MGKRTTVFGALTLQTKDGINQPKERTDNRLERSYGLYHVAVSLGLVLSLRAAATRSAGERFLSV